jgi:hypothetical protein
MASADDWRNAPDPLSKDDELFSLPTRSVFDTIDVMLMFAEFVEGFCRFARNEIPYVRTLPYWYAHPEHIMYYV